MLEVLVAIGILAFGILAIATMQASSIKGNSHAIGITEAITLAQAKIEGFLSLPYNHSNFDDGAGANDGVAGLNDSLANSDKQDPDNPIQLGNTGRMFNVYWNVAVNDPLTNVKTVRVIVEWTERGKQRKASMDYMKAAIF